MTSYQNNFNNEHAFDDDGQFGLNNINDKKIW